MIVVDCISLFSGIMRNNSVRRGVEAIIVSVVLCNVLLCIDRGCGCLLTILNAYDFSINETVINFTFGFYMGL